MKISPNGLKFIERWEVFVPFWYDDKSKPLHNGSGTITYRRWQPGEAVRGTLTCAIGHTKAAHAHVECPLEKDLTHAEALEILDTDLAPVEEFLNHVIKVEVTQSQFDALGSLVYNIGEGNFSHSTVLRQLNAGNYQAARAAFDRFTMSKGEHMVGLQRRRDAEQALWDEHPNVEAFMPADGEIVEHPADVDPHDAKTMAKSTEGWTSIAQTVGGGSGVAEQTINASDIADKAIAAKDKAEAFGIEPIHMFDKINETLAVLVHQPAFWFCLAVSVAGAYLYLRRRYKLKLEF